MRSIVALAAISLLAIVLTNLGSARPVVPGPGAVIHMHEQLFAAADRGDHKGVIGFLHPDMNMDQEYRERPCTLFLPDQKGELVECESYAESRKALYGWAKAQTEAGGTWKTSVRSLGSDCFSSELSYAVLEVDRSHTVDGKTTTQRFVSTALVTYDDGWKLTHWHLSPVPLETAR